MKVPVQTKFYCVLEHPKTKNLLFKQSWNYHEVVEYAKRKQEKGYIIKILNDAIYEDAGKR